MAGMSSHAIIRSMGGEGGVQARPVVYSISRRCCIRSPTTAVIIYRDIQRRSPGHLVT